MKTTRMNYVLVLIFFNLMLLCNETLAQDNLDVITLKSGKVFKGKLLPGADSLNLQMLTDDEMEITIKKDNIESVVYAKIDTTGFKKAHYFNFPVGTKFITEVKSKDIVSKNEVEIVDVQENEIKTKSITYAYGATQQVVIWSKVRYDENSVSYYLGSPEITFQEGSSEWMSYPVNPEVGTVLPDITMKGKIYSEGIKLSFKANFVNQKVILKETITTPAGTFDCYLLTYTMSSQMLLIKIKSDVKCWISDKFGIIKIEGYIGKGELQSTSILESVH
ncbi:MAG TPA: hypothetical protein PLG30_10790 [Bacteroidia bacterium]|nr:hypothetical protein [Bacteroidia bacterium]